jgi:hypothetical protein
MTINQLCSTDSMLKNIEIDNIIEDLILQIAENIKNTNTKI